MKDNLVGRVVGYSVPHHPIDPDPENPGPYTTTRWARVNADMGGTLYVTSIHRRCAPVENIARAVVHTTMPKSY